ncbi:DUF397 domain-containing protein [Streptomyces sp. NPDC051569]|uniref:DUF397 domain-containing protein n=1 Tax=Streptomyces sp. NPDC051569 TaxID=3365661 RepID=UPI0037B5472C
MNDDRKAELHTFDLAGAPWRKASASAGENNCVEVAQLPHGGKAVRDSKRPGAGALRYTATAWAAFSAGLVSGDF